MARDRMPRAIPDRSGGIVLWPGIVVLLTCAPRDWAGITADEVAEHILDQVGPGDVVCLHDGTPPRDARPDATCEPTAAALSVVVPELRRRGLELVTVSNLLT